MARRSRANARAGRNTRPPLERMMRIHRELQTGDFPNASRLASELEVAPKTIYRDLEFMRSRLNLPIEYDESRFGFCYTQPVDSFPAVQISEGELVSLVVAEKALQQYRGTSFEKPLLSALQKIAQSLPDTISLSLDGVQQTISFRTSVEPILDLGIFDALARATSGRRQLTFDYRKPGQTQPEQRVVDPYHLANINGEWFLFAFDHSRKAVRTFVPARMRSIQETGLKFPPPTQFSLRDRLRDSFNVHSAEGTFDVIIRFSARAADYVREKKWHESQRVKDLKDGGLELSLRLSSLREVQRWILSWGGDALPLSPPELIHQIREAAQRLLDQTGPR